MTRAITPWSGRGQQSVDVAVLVVGSESREEVLVSAAKSLTQHVMNPLTSKYNRVTAIYCLQSIAPNTMRHLCHFGSVLEKDVLIFDAKDQFERLDSCFSTLDKRYSNFTFYIKTRPDIIWLEDITLSFHAEAIMLRARRISQGRITMQHLSWPVGCDCEQSGCVMVDSMVAVVPHMWRRAYFSTSTEIESIVAKNLSGLQVDRHEGRLFHLTKDWRTKCPCATLWAEGRLTLHLASLEVSVLVEAFNFVLAPPKRNGSHWRQGEWGTRVHESAWFTCK